MANKDRAENGAAASHPRRANILPVFSPGYGHTLPARTTPASARDAPSSFRGRHHRSEYPFSCFSPPLPIFRIHTLTRSCVLPASSHSSQVEYDQEPLTVVRLQTCAKAASGIARSREASPGPDQQPIDYLDIVSLIHGSGHPSDIASPRKNRHKTRPRYPDAD